MSYELVELDGVWADQMAFIERIAQVTPWHRELILSSLAIGARAWGLVDKTKPKPRLFGFVLVGLMFDTAEILTFSIDPSFQRLGLGKSLLNSTLSWLSRDAGIKSVFLEVRQTNHAAIALYQQLNFCTVGKRKNYYRLNSEHDNAQVKFEDALVMRRLFV